MPTELPKRRSRAPTIVRMAELRWALFKVELELSVLRAVNAWDRSAKRRLDRRWRKNTAADANLNASTTMSDAPLTPGQVTAARRLLDWSQGDLAGQVGVSATTVAIFEIGKRRLPILDLSAVRAALESAGVIFVEENGEGPGVRLRKAAK